MQGRVCGRAECHLPMTHVVRMQAGMSDGGLCKHVNACCLQSHLLHVCGMRHTPWQPLHGPCKDR